jgi:hypothetical protein
VNTNVNGYKTDGVIDETIEHKAIIEADGSVTDTLTITRAHNGGDSEHDWWNKVNADYMRVYVPKGSKLISVEGQTRETDNKPPLDYDALGFTRDADIAAEENTIQIDPESTTRIFEESGKTVFGNWVYVSPKEKVTIRYTYKLPFTLSGEGGQESALRAYSLFIQKQSGSMGSQFTSQIVFPKSWDVLWSHPETVRKDLEALEYSSVLRTDAFVSTAFKAF